MSRLAHAPRPALATCMLVLGAMIAFPLGVIASHQFSDVPDSNAYHADIDAVADAGVTTGCGNGTTYCPSAFVTREQMAAFMNRLGALQAGKTPVVNATKLDGLNSTQFERSDVAKPGRFKCAGPAMVPQDSSVAWGVTQNYAYPASTTDVTFRCNVDLPDGATVTGVTWKINDDSSVNEASCGLDRVTFTASAMASAHSGIAETRGNVDMSDLTITGAVINTLTYAYVGWCTLTGSSPLTAVYSIRVDYLL